MRDVAWRDVVSTLVHVEQLSASECGLLSAAENGHRGIFVERGRICWVAAPGMQQRLTDLLRHLAAVRDIDLDDIYQRCRNEGRPLGQMLVDEGWMAPRELETALRRHSAESLVALCGGGAPLTAWSSRGTQSYAARFTFRPIDVLLDVIELFLPHLQHSAHRELVAADRPERRGGAFYLPPALDGVVPVAAFGGDLTVSELVELGSWAMAVPLAMRELGTSPVFTLAGRADGAAVAIWARAPLLFAVECSDRRDALVVATEHAARRWA